MKARGIFKVAEYTNTSGTTSYRVTGTLPDGKRVRENYGTKPEAEGRKSQLEIEAQNLPSIDGLRRTWLTDEQLADAERAVKELDGRTTLFNCSRYFIQNYREPFKKKLLAEALDDFIKAKQNANRREDTIRNLKGRIGKFSTWHPGKLVSDISANDVQDFLSRPGCSPRNVINDRLALSCFFKWALKQEFCFESPIAKVDRVIADRDEPEILTIAQVRKIMDAAANYKNGILVPYFALGTFAAIRPTELARISWSEINLKRKTITIGSKLAKMRQKRIVELSDNCVEWLLPHVTKHTPLRGANWRKDFDAVKELAGFGNPKRKLKKKETEEEKKKRESLTPWTQDIMRHTGISYHLAKHEHEGKTATWAGNSPDTCHKHYKGLVEDDDVNQFWTIRPDAEKIISLEKAA